MPELTLAELVDLYLERHAATVRPRTIHDAARAARATPLAAFGDVPLRDLERMCGEIASLAGQAARTLPLRHHAGAPPDARRRRPLGLHGRTRRSSPGATRSRHRGRCASTPRTSSRRSPPSCARPTGRCPPSPPPPGCAPRSGRRSNAATSTAPPASLNVRRTVSQRRGGGAGQDDPPPPAGAALAACARRARRDPAAARHAAPVPGRRGRAVRPRQLPPPRVGAGDRGVRRRTPARIYDLRSTFARNALAAGVIVFELARIMGTSVPMIERHYGALLDGAGADIARRLDAFEDASGRRRGLGH